MQTAMEHRPKELSRLVARPRSSSAQPGKLITKEELQNVVGAHNFGSKTT